MSVSDEGMKARLSLLTFHIFHHSLFICIPSACLSHIRVLFSFGFLLVSFWTRLGLPRENQKKTKKRNNKTSPSQRWIKRRQNSDSSCLNKKKKKYNNVSRKRNQKPVAPKLRIGKLSSFPGPLLLITKPASILFVIFAALLTQQSKYYKFCNAGV